MKVEFADREAGVKCGACEHWASDRAGQVSVRLPGETIKATVWKCSFCGTYIQDGNYDDLGARGHFDIASYTSPEEEERWRVLRTRFFRWIIDISRRHLGRQPSECRALDIGIAYGIMMGLLRDGGVNAEGVEIVPVLRETVRKRGFVVYDSLDDVPARAQDLVFAVDSFYYLDDPEKALRKVRSLIAPGGVLTIRLANRAWYFDLMRRFGREVSEHRFGDLKYFYTERGARLLLERTGFRIERIYWSDRGRRDPRFLESIFYKLAPLTTYILPVKLSPGMLIIARPAV